LTDVEEILTIRGVATGYGRKQVLFDVAMSVKAGAIAAIIGPNGAGKSTVLKVVGGLLPVWSGSVAFAGVSLKGWSSVRRVRQGIAFCPQGNRVFSGMTVRENIELGGAHLPTRAVASRVAGVMESFPQLKSRLKQRAGTLSGGEQQMVAIARALVSSPRLLLLDEPSLGLSPGVLGEVLRTIIEVSRTQSATILIVEQKVRQVLAIADHVYSLKLGRVAYDGLPAPLLTDKAKLTALFL